MYVKRLQLNIKLVFKLPLILAIGIVSDSVTNSLFQFPTLYEANMIVIGMAIMFLIVVSMVVGFFIDKVRDITKQGGFV
jgi:type III secretory pathway component EscU